MKVVAYLPAQHRADCPAWDHWQCNCGAEPIPLVRLDEAQAKPAWSITQAEQDAMSADQWDAWKAAMKASKEDHLLEAYANGRKDEAEQEAEDSKRWRMLPAFLEEHQIDYLLLLRDIDGAIAAQTAQSTDDKTHE